MHADARRSAAQWLASCSRAAGFVLTMVALGLVVILRRPAEVDHMMARADLRHRRRRHTSLAGRSDRDTADRGRCIAGAVCCVRGRRVRQKRVRPAERGLEAASGG